MNTGSKGRYVRSVEEWKESLTADQFRILRQNGTERPFKNQYWDNQEVGTYVCAGCGNVLFRSENKFDSGTGWPSFTAPYCEEAVENVMEIRFSKRRIAVSCARCGGHLGHVFTGEQLTPKNVRHCVNSLSLKFVPKKGTK